MRQINSTPLHSTRQLRLTCLQYINISNRCCSSRGNLLNLATITKIQYQTAFTNKHINSNTHILQKWTASEAISICCERFFSFPFQRKIEWACWVCLLQTCCRNHKRDFTINLYATGKRLPGHLGYGFYQARFTCTLDYSIGLNPIF